MKKPIFIIQKHNATHLHYDFRIEVEGVLKSWAFPKIPKEKIGIKRLAIQVPDHPLSYATFEGIIPAGTYGAGTVTLWDKGTYKNITEKNGLLIPLDQALAQGFVKIELVGTKMNGVYLLLKTRYKNGKSWLFMRIKKIS